MCRIQICKCHCNTINEVGETIYIGTDRLRLRYREGLEKAKFATPNEIFLCQFDSPYITAIEVEKGSRFVLTINAINADYLQKNYNSGKDVSIETNLDARKAEIKIYNSPENASYLTVPVSRKQ